jgi:hypothetical protein
VVDSHHIEERFYPKGILHGSMDFHRTGAELLREAGVAAEVQYGSLLSWADTPHEDGAGGDAGEDAGGDAGGVGGH